MTDHPLINEWLSKRHWKLLPFQVQAWEAISAGQSGLISVPTGAGKTFAAYLPALAKLIEKPSKGLQILYITPLKALATDLEQALRQPIEELNLPYKVERRTGDTKASVKSRQNKNLPHVLLTTPESLALLLTQADAATHFQHLQMIIVDEWHELLSTKRGVLLELCLSRIKQWATNAQIWALTATVGNLQEAAQTCVGMDRTATVITAQMDRDVVIESILPESVDKLPWVGYLGLRLLPLVIARLDPAVPTLIFTNTRSQAERWFQAIVETKSEWLPITALHHGSIDKAQRTQIESQIKSGELSFVVCTSALDLGIDLPFVKRVIQIGSPKSVARLVQRAGRSSHRPFTPCHISLVPTHALQLFEIKAYRKAVDTHVIESRRPLKLCYDVLLQHIVTCAIGGGIAADNLYTSVRSTLCFAELSRQEFEKCLAFLISGGQALQAYPEYRKVIQDDGVLRVIDPQIIRRHKMNIGTIVADATAVIKLARGKALGTIEESFLTQLKPGDVFLFGGRHLKLMQYRDLTAQVRLSTAKNTQVAVWGGTSLPFSTSLGDLLRRSLALQEASPEAALIRQIADVQNAKSHLPDEHELLMELVKSREGYHLFLFPFEGKTTHEAIALLIAHRLSQHTPSTLITSCNDYGIELLSKTPYDESLLNSNLFDSADALQEFKSLINMHETSKATFRGIARIAGLVFQGFPGRHKSNRQLQMSSGLLFSVLQRYDSENIVLQQAKDETLEHYVEHGRLLDVLKRLQQSMIVTTRPKWFTPFSLPLFVERVSHRLSTESLLQRIEAIQKSWTKR